ncbi:nucleotidyltransferase [Mesobacillus maritimus]|uniref:Nucleotidyltransferase n=1 Tax=Mesobacillus maritimus TaxID=1643336 RepID=A0ABS7K7Z5_9BACI|nr:nucleotidyltransferase [Mesobacillus maritimus]
MRNSSSYLMFVGIFMVALSGNWVLNNYDRVSVYPKTSYIIFGIGLGMVVLAYVMNKLSTYKEVQNVEKRDNREFINLWEQQRMPVDKVLVGVAILALVFAAFYSWSLVFRLVELFLFIGIVFIGFLFVMKGDRVEEPDDLDFKGKVKKFHDRIDYRRHPFTISLIIYVLVIGSFLLSKQWDIPLYMEVSGNPRYVTSLPDITFIMSGLMVISAYIYIINNGDLFGIRKAQQNGLKVLQLHFAEIIICGPTFFIWIVVVIEALIVHF